MFRSGRRKDGHSEAGISLKKELRDTLGVDNTTSDSSSKSGTLKKVCRKIAAIAMAATVIVSTIPSPAALDFGLASEVAVHKYSVRMDSPFTRSDQAMIALQRMYDPLTGSWNGWWNTANALLTVIDNASQTHNYQFVWDIKNTFVQNDVNNFINSYGDDSGWWAITWIRAYDLTKNKEYLTTAEAIFKHLANTWNSTCGGGIPWNTGQFSGTPKGALTNEIFLIVSSMLYERTSNTKYLDWARKEYLWFTNSGLIGKSDLVYNSLNSSCKVKKRSPWTYIQGEAIGAFVEFSKATGDKKPIYQAELIANANDSYNVDENGILLEKTCCYGGSLIFKGMYIENLYILYQADHKKEYKNFIIKNANALWSNDRNGNYAIGVNWAGPFTGANQSTQSAGIDVLDEAEVLSQTSASGHHR